MSARLLNHASNAGDVQDLEFQLRPPPSRQAHLDMAQEYEHGIRRLAAEERKLEAYPPRQALAGLEAAGLPKLEQLGLPDRQYA